MWRPPNLPIVTFYFLNKFGWPVETVKGRPIQNFIRLLIHTRKITTKWYIGNVPWASATCTHSLNELVTPYRPMMEPPDFSSLMNQKGFMVMPPLSWPRPGQTIGFLGSKIDIGDDDETKNMMKPEER